MKKTLLAGLFSLIILFTVGLTTVYAVCPPDCGGTGPTGPGGSGPTGPGGTGPTGPGGSGPTSFNIPNPFGNGVDSLYDLVRVIIQDILMPIGGMLAVLAFIYSGFLYVTAQGNESKLKTAHTALLYTVIGTAVLLGSWTIANVIENTIDKLK